ncbi:Rib/alpha-like domain-containing protein, partial [Staphylococcus sp. SQ8-PEA]
MKHKKSKSKLDFLPNRHNRYSIRRFTVGTASILIGATLLLGASNDAKAAEEDSSEVSVDNKDEASSSEDGQVAESTKEESTEATTDQDQVETKAQDTTTQAQEKKQEESTSDLNDEVSEDSKDQSQDTEATQDKSQEAEVNQENPSTSKETLSNDKKAEDTKVEKTAKSTVKEAKSEDKKVNTEDSVAQDKPQATEEEVVTNKEDKVNATATEADKKAAQEDPSPYADITSVHDRDSAVDFYSKATGVSAKEAKRVVNNLGLDKNNYTPESFRVALINALAAAQNQTPKATIFRAAPSNPNTATALANATNAAGPTADSDNAKVVEADAIKNGYIKSATDMTNAKFSLSGRAYVADFGTPGTVGTRLTPVPEGTKVYMQWIDKDGWVSPTFQAATSNRLTQDDLSQAGPGAYAFDLRKPQIDANGKKHEYLAIDGQYYRLWIEDFKTAQGNTATMLRQAGGLIPGAFVNSVTGLNIGQFPLIGTNMQRTGIFMGVKPANSYMTRPKKDWINDKLGPIGSPAVNLSARNSISGKVWLETGAGDEANSATGPNKAPKEPAAQGYTVVFSSLTKEGAAAYKTQVANLDNSQRADAAKRLLEAHPEYISATVYGLTDKDGNYTVRFPNDKLNDDYIYGYVINPKGELMNGYSSFTTPQFTKANKNLLFTPQAAPAQNLVANPMWYNVNFALIPKTDINLNILDFNNTDKPAVPGDVAHIDLDGQIFSPLPTHIEWRDKDGKVVKKTKDFTTLTEGEAISAFEIPATAKDGDHYTAVLVVNDRDMAADSLTVKVTDARSYEPKVTPITKEYGQSTSPEDVRNAVTIPNYPAGKGTPTVTVDEGATLPDGNTPGKTDVPVTVRYPDGSVDHVTVPVTVKEQPQADKYEPKVTPVEREHGTPVTSGDVTGAVTVPGYPTEGDQPTVTVDEGATLPDGNTPGKTDVPVTVRYPDGTEDHVTVPVTIKEQPQADKYEPKVTPVEREHGTPVTSGDVTGAVTVPGYPTEGKQPTVTVDKGAKLPDGNTSGKTDVPVTVRYPDGTEDHVTVPVTIKEQPQADKYEPKVTPVEREHGTPVTSDDVTGAVTVPGYPTEGKQPTVTVDKGAKLPDGNTSGKTDVPVTVRYPDGTEDHV